ncbi:30S ribosomal protein S2 [Mycoplasmopsis columboralis]|uniref:Small ribosomal subunit protein uS2 n=1 Tax=Mycoplasmopsis columboralis TaxID=171282 RepID=A0A449B6B6_9BACT|nr:30S ribosomal protein S2 [Mycoplasmopsis columboralis]VEU76092.1 Vegetative protein 209 [Mycoplasmopsis columboralis]
MENTKKQTAEKAVKAQTPIVSKDKLLEAGAYFGHKVKDWNPKMKEFLVPNKKNKGSHIIDLTKTQKYLEFAYSLVNKLASKNASFIFVGTKKQAKAAIQAAAQRVGAHYVSERWLGGTLTNNRTIMSSVKTMNELEEKKAQGYKGYTKKEALEFDKKLEKLHKNLDGIKNMKSLPQVMIVADPIEDAIAVKEAKRKKIKVISLLDSNANPDAVDFGIPANDDSAKSITLVITVLADAIAKAQGKEQLYAYQGDEKVVLPEFQSKKAEQAAN